MYRTRTRKQAGIISILTALALSLGCTNVQVSNDFDPDAKFSGLSTYAWAPAGESTNEDPRVANDLTDKRVRTAVDRVLAEKGYRLSSSGKPDFWITYHAGVESKVDITTLYRNYPYQSGYAAWGGYTDTIVTEYDQGSLVLDIVDPSTERLIWRGTGQAEVHDDASAQKRTELVNKAVEKILAQFPPEMN